MGTRQLVTAEQLERMGENDYDFELVAGELVPMTPSGGEHGEVAMDLGTALNSWVKSHDLSRVYAAETGFVLRRDPDTVRAPDIGFVTTDRVRLVRKRRGFIQGTPDLAIEVRSPDDTMAELTRKAADYLAAGTRLVWIVDPIKRRAHVHRPGREPLTLNEDGSLDGGDLLPGFSLSLAELFATLD